MVTRRRFLRGVALLGLLALAAPVPAPRPTASPAAAAVYPRYAQVTTPLDHWQRRTAPVLVADQPWEQGVVAEPTVLYQARLYRLWYFGGWMRAGVGYAWSTDGVRWHKHHGPVLGLGAGGWRGTAAHSSVTYWGGLYYLYFAADSPDAGLHLATSADGVHFRTGPASVLRPTATERRLANTDVWHDEGGWHMLYDAMTPDGTWQTGLASGTGPGAWRRVAFPLPTLRVGQGGTYGAPTHRVSRTQGRIQYDLWYLASRTRGSVLPTDIYHARSSDLLHWRRLGSGPVLPRARPWEVDQTADPSVLLVPGRRLLYYAGMDNDVGGRTPHGAIGLASERP